VLEEHLMFEYTSYSTFLENIDNKKIEKEILLYKEQDAGRRLSNLGGWQSNNIEIESDFFKNSETKNLLQMVCASAEYLYGLWGISTSPKLSNFWFNINEKKDVNESHSHPNNYFSFCYYVKAKENSGELVFIRDDNFSHYEIPATMNRYTFESYMFLPSPGLLVGFPSYIKHRVNPNMNDETRISIAFNFK
jgi:uncharacterized protein (TIGR02466 family)